MRLFRLVLAGTALTAIYSLGSVPIQARDLNDRDDISRICSTLENDRFPL